MNIFTTLITIKQLEILIHKISNQLIRFNVMTYMIRLIRRSKLCIQTHRCITEQVTMI